jgi:hypothetical protein
MFFIIHLNCILHSLGPLGSSSKAADCLAAVSKQIHSLGSATWRDIVRAWESDKLSWSKSMNIPVLFILMCCTDAGRSEFSREGRGAIEPVNLLVLLVITISIKGAMPSRNSKRNYSNMLQN